MSRKIGLGERGPVWWDDGEPDYNRRLIQNSPHAMGWIAEGANEETWLITNRFPLSQIVKVQVESLPRPAVASKLGTH